MLHVNEGMSNDHDSIDIVHVHYFAEVLPQYGKANKIKQSEIVSPCVYGVKHMGVGVNELGYEMDEF